jgi:hypothetical protein
MMSRVEEQFAGASPPVPDDVNMAFWQACHGGQKGAAEYLLARGADLNWVPSWAKQTLLDIAEHSGAVDLVKWLRERDGRSAGAKSKRD